MSGAVHWIAANKACSVTFECVVTVAWQRSVGILSRLMISISAQRTVSDKKSWVSAPYRSQVKVVTKLCSKYAIRGGYCKGRKEDGEKDR